MTDHPDLGWSDPVGTRVSLQVALRELAQGRRKTDDRFTRASYALVTLHPRDFPVHLRALATEVLGLRGGIAVTVGTYTYFPFSTLTGRRRAQFADDLLTLYEACLIDIGRTWPRWDFVYPGEAAPAP